jgi:hypothetical protein
MKVCYCGADYSHRGHKARTCGSEACLAHHMRLWRAAQRETELAAKRDRGKLQRAAAAAARPPTFCQWCGVEINRHPNAKYCSLECKREVFKRAHPDYHEQWQRKKPPPRPSPEQQAAYNRNRRARKRSNRDYRPVSLISWQRMLTRHNHRCFYCGSAGVLTQDHIIPLSRGGRHGEGNLVPACLSCNRSKASRLLIEWRRVKQWKEALSCPA